MGYEIPSQPTQMKKVIYIQAWANKSAKHWDDVQATRHEVDNPLEIAQTIADVMGCAVRMTYHIDGVKIGSLNGSYFHPKALSILSASNFYPVLEATSMRS